MQNLPQTIERMSHTNGKITTETTNPRQRLAPSQKISGMTGILPHFWLASFPILLFTFSPSFITYQHEQIRTT